MVLIDPYSRHHLVGTSLVVL